MNLPVSAIKTGYYLGAGAALNIAVGFLPRRVDLHNVTDGTIEATGYLDKMVPFSSGATSPPLKNDGSGYAKFKIKGATSGAVGLVKDVILVSGTFAGGNAAGFFVLDAEDITGTFGAENVGINGSGNADAAVTAAVEHTLYQATTAGDVAGSGNTGITSFVGSAAAAKGFSVGSTLAVSAKLYRWTAYR